ncbi:MAG: FecR family protein [Methylophilus sp.]|uniref:FecR family protein n=1 Tax=Methylophilus sp. TaxID=29541 RepID=UPI003FA112ED
MNTHHKQDPNFIAESDPNISDLLPYIKAAKDKFPSQAELFAEVNKDRDSRKNKIKAIQYAVAVAFCTLGLWKVNPTISSETYTTQYAESQQFSLPDGSSVHLNSNTHLTAKFRLFSRELYLDKGEASFSVQHGIRPFTVAVDQTKVLDIGTVFNIARWDHAFIATVLEGEVELQTGDHQLRLTSGQSLKVSDLGFGVPYEANMDMVTAWQTGKIIFNRTALKEAVANIQRYIKEPIQLDSRVEDLLITGIYDVSSVGQLIDSMDSMFPVKVVRLSDGEIKIQKN